MVGGSVMRDASGNINDLFNIYNTSVLRSIVGLENNTIVENETVLESIPEKTWSIYGTAFNCTPPHCPYGTHNSFQVHFLSFFTHFIINSFLLKINLSLCSDS